MNARKGAGRKRMSRAGGVWLWHSFEYSCPFVSNVLCRESDCRNKHIKVPKHEQQGFSKGMRSE